MRRRRLLLGSGMVGLLCVPWLIVIWDAPPRPGITRRNYERIREGMTFAEVEAILGPEGYQTKRLVIVGMEGTMFRRWWIGDEAVITIEFGPKDDAPTLPPFEKWQVGGKHYGELEPEPFLDRLRHLLPW